MPQATRVGEGSRGVILTMVAMACVGTVLLVALTVACLRHHARQLASGKLGLGPEAGVETHFDYQVAHTVKHTQASTQLQRHTKIFAILYIFSRKEMQSECIKCIQNDS